MFFPAMLIYFPNSKVCLIRNWSICTQKIKGQRRHKLVLREPLFLLTLDDLGLQHLTLLIELQGLQGYGIDYLNITVFENEILNALIFRPALTVLLTYLLTGCKYCRRQCQTDKCSCFGFMHSLHQ